MASEALPTPLLLTLTLLSFIIVRSSACTPIHTPNPAPISPPIAPSVPPPSHPPSPPPTHSPSPSPPPPTSSPPPPSPSPSPPPPTSSPPPPSPSPSPPPPTSSPPPPPARCPVDILRLSVCARVLNLVDIIIGPQRTPCCTLINGLVDLDAAVCLCTAIKANVLGAINVRIPVAVSLILNRCGKDNSGFICN